MIHKRNSLFFWPNYKSNQKKNLKGNPEDRVTVGVGGFTLQSGVQGDLHPIYQQELEGHTFKAQVLTSHCLCCYHPGASPHHLSPTYHNSLQTDLPLLLPHHGLLVSQQPEYFLLRSIKSCHLSVQHSNGFSSRRG